MTERMKLHSSGFFSILLTLMLYACALQVQAAPLPRVETEPPNFPHQVLILNSHSVGIPWATLLNQAIIETFSEDILSGKVQMHVEYTGLSQHLDTTYQERLIELYQHKYRDHPPALILAADVSAIEFIKTYRHRLFPKVPVVFTADGGHTLQDEYSEDIIGISTHLDIARNLETILHLHPNTRQFAVIGGADPAGRNLAAMIHQAMAPSIEEYPVIDLVGLPMAELLDRVAHLPEQTVVLYTVILVDGDGERFIPREILAHLSQAANAPIYSFWDTMLGFGMVGGYVSDTHSLGRQMASVGQKILAGTPPQAISVDQGPLAFHFDWKQLQRWNLSLRRLPQDSILHNQEITPWQLYRLEISAALAIIALLLVAVTILLFIRRHLRIQVAQRTQLLIQANTELEEANTRLLTLSHTDGLTGIANRRRFDEVFHLEWKRAKRSGLALSVALLDVDWFKKYNDHYGHQAGDDCLCQFAQIFAATVSRAGDLAARYGGEEFALIVPASDSLAVLEVATQICRQLEQCAIPHALSPYGYVTVSIGVATFDPVDTQIESSEQLLQYADEALYQAKAQGRNRVLAHSG